VDVDYPAIAAALPAYELGDELGRGGWAIVLAGRHRRLDRPVAIKQLTSAVASQPGVRARFASEARALASLDHPHIVPIYDFVEHEGLCLLVMERLLGGSLQDRVDSTGLTAPAACAATVAVCSALDHAHQRGVLHRDVKPQNLLFTAGGELLKVADFGISKVLGGAETPLTQTGQLLGTPAYMAPEQAQGKGLGPATDVYAVGTVLYELLTGRLPYSAEGGVAALLYQRVHEDPHPFGEADRVPPGLATAVLRALARDPAHRHPTAVALGTAIAAAAADAWGERWLGRSGIVVRGAEAVLGRAGAGAEAGPVGEPMATEDASPPPAAPPGPRTGTGHSRRRATRHAWLAVAGAALATVLAAAVLLGRDDGDRTVPPPDAGCLPAYLQGIEDAKVTTVEAGSRDLTVRGVGVIADESFALVLTDGGRTFAALRLDLVAAGPFFRVQSAVDAACQPVAELANATRGGDSRFVQNHDALLVRVGDAAYFLRMGATSRVQVNLLPAA
jgi:serine/threonine-protein kinase